MKKTIQIEEEKCIGCGLCANTCHQSAIEIIQGKAKIVRDDICDGLGRCLPVCPVNAISFVEIEETGNKKDFTCPSEKVMSIQGEKEENTINTKPSTHLNQWPIQIKLVPVTAAYFHNAHLLVAADCSAFSHGNFHQEFMKNRITIIGCPKLDQVEYAEKLTEIISKNQIKSLTVVRMEVPCCGGIENATVTALKNSGKDMPLDVHTLTIQ